jgi:hypothetical protein
MNRFVMTALAIAVAGTAAQAGSGDNEWTALDSEISGLASSLKPSQDGTGWAVLLQAVYTHSSDDLFTTGGVDTSGFNFKNADIAFWGAQGIYSWRFSADIDNNEAGSGTSFELEDAYVRWNCGGYFDAMMGNFKPHISHSNSVDPEKLLFIDRSVLGSAGDFWDNGIGASGAYDMFRWYAGLLNGANGQTRDHFYYVRGEFDMGTGAGMYEGAMGSSDTLNATAGLTLIHDDNVDANTDGDNNHEDNAWLLDFHGSLSQIGFGAEVASFDDDFQVATDEDWGNSAANSFLVVAGDSTPWSVYGSYLINQDWEVGVRYEDLDNGDNNGPDNTVLSVGASWYRGANAGKWQAQYTMVNADSAFNDGNLFEVGYSIGTTR